jgi:hypothetical protein
MIGNDRCATTQVVPLRTLLSPLQAMEKIRY